MTEDEALKEWKRTPWGDGKSPESITYHDWMVRSDSAFRAGFKAGYAANAAQARELLATRKTQSIDDLVIQDRLERLESREKTFDGHRLDTVEQQLACIAGSAMAVHIGKLCERIEHLEERFKTTDTDWRAFADTLDNLALRTTALELERRWSTMDQAHGIHSEKIDTLRERVAKLEEPL